MKKYFYDTNALLTLGEKIIESPFVVSDVSLYELEHIKISRNKDEQVKYSARQVIHILDENPKAYDVVVFNSIIANEYMNGLPDSPDNRICACAAHYRDNSLEDELVFVSDDICCKVIAAQEFGLKVEGINSEKDDCDYLGYKEVIMSDDEMAYFYEHMNDNIYELLVNEYMLVKNKDGNTVDKYKWTADGHQKVKVGSIKSDYFGVIKPYNGDELQMCVLDSMLSNQVTMVKGRAGTGKSYLALGVLMHMLEKHKIEKIVVFCNTIATSFSAKLGYYPGTRNEKLLDSQIGNMLASKLGGITAVERMIEDNELLLLPMSDIRGFDTTGMNCGVYITEGQNMNISLMKLALQRIGEDSICIIDGDYNTQVDLASYAGRNNGMRRMSEVFKGQDFYGEIELKNIYRSRIAKIAENM